jgi:hypothetical protein
MAQGTATGAPNDLRDPLLTPPNERYTLRFEPSAFFAAPGGKLRLAGSPIGGDTVRLENLDLDVPRISPFVELHLRSDNWRFSVSGFETSLHDRGSVQLQSGQIGTLLYNPGDQLTSSMNFGTGEVVVARELGAPDSISGKKDPDFSVGFEAYGGFRFYDVSFDIRGPGGSVNADEFFVQPIVGVKTTMSIIDRFTFDVQLGVGGFMEGAGKHSHSFDILVGFMYRPTTNLGVQIGYRLFIYDLQDGPATERFEYRGAVAGLYGGLVLRF